MPRRARDSSRVRAAIRTELEEVAEEAPGSDDELATKARAPSVICLEDGKKARELATRMGIA